MSDETGGNQGLRSARALAVAVTVAVLVAACGGSKCPVLRQFQGSCAG